MKNKQFMQRICNTFIFDNINFLQCTIGWFRRQADLEGRAFTVKDLPFTPLAPLGRGLGRGAYQMANGGPEVRRSSGFRR